MLAFGPDLAGVWLGHPSSNDIGPALRGLFLARPHAYAQRIRRLIAMPAGAAVLSAHSTMADIDLAGLATVTDVKLKR